MIVADDVLDRHTLPAAMAGVRVAYYLIHALDSPGAFEEEDRRAARHFGEVAKAAGVQRIIYLAGRGTGPPCIHCISWYSLACCVAL